jgi:hypothetical protein
LSITRKVLKVVSLKAQRFLDLRRCTYAENTPSGPLERVFPAVDPDWLAPHAEGVHALASLALQHRFDLLGSGWVQVKPGMACRGVEGHRYDNRPTKKSETTRTGINKANLEEAKRIRTFIDPAYVPIDWHLDFKSGFRWSERTWYLDVPFGHLPGVDIKVPWELARMQHLPQLAFAFILTQAGHEGFDFGEKPVQEFRNEVLDFIAANPPRFGVNWRCAMDVGVRVVNWLVAYDLFRACGVSFDEAFDALFRRSILEHGRHILENLEWHPAARNNHYLANLVGLLFTAAALPRTEEIDAWLAFTRKELLEEVLYQFHADGTNFEGSTCYHRLSSEMVLYAAALMMGLPKDRREAMGVLNPDAPAVPPDVSERLEKAGEFIMHVTKPCGHVPQIGDNDNGRFLNLHPPLTRMTVKEARERFKNLEGFDALPDDADYWVQDFLDHRHLVAALNGLFGRDDFTAFAGEDRFEGDLVRRLAQGNLLPSYLAPGKSPAAAQYRVEIGKEELPAPPDTEAGEPQNVHRIPAGTEKFRKEITLFGYPVFGLYVFRSTHLYLAIRCTAHGGITAHLHNDQLGVELTLNGEDLFRDPGTYLYTPLPDRRNAYRSVKAHFAPQLEGFEPGKLDAEVFRLDNASRATCVYFGPRGFIGSTELGGCQLTRAVAIEDSGLVITDSISLLDEERKGCVLLPADRAPGPVPFSPGYGIQERTEDPERP